MEKLDLNHIRDLIIKGNVQGALDKLLDILQSSRKLHSQLRDDIIMLRTQLNDVVRKENLNLISLDEAGRERAQLQKGILDVINSLEEPSYAPAVRVPMGSGKRLRWAVAGAMILLVLILGIAFRNELVDAAGAMATIQQEQEPSISPDLAVVVDNKTADNAQPKKANLVVSNIEFYPYPPKKGEQTEVVVHLKNKGNYAARNAAVQWWADENAPNPAKTWTEINLNPGEETRLSFSYSGHTGWQGSLQTKAVADPGGWIDDADRSDNEFIRTISVQRSAPSVQRSISNVRRSVTAPYNEDASYYEDDPYSKVNSPCQSSHQ